MKAEGRRQKAEVLSSLLGYPDRDLLRRAAENADDFYAEVKHVSLDGLEELYTRTFDLNPVASLDLGWHLYGEQYERGRLLAELRGRQAKLGIDSGTELPDHLTVVLRMLRYLDGNDPLRGQFAAAIAKIRATLDEQGNPYRHLIRAAEAEVTC